MDPRGAIRTKLQLDQRLQYEPIAALTSTTMTHADGSRLVARTLVGHAMQSRLACSIVWPVRWAANAKSLNSLHCIACARVDKRAQSHTRVRLLTRSVKMPLLSRSIAQHLCALFLACLMDAVSGQRWCR